MYNFVPATSKSRHPRPSRTPILPSQLVDQLMIRFLNLTKSLNFSNNNSFITNRLNPGKALTQEKLIMKYIDSDDFHFILLFTYSYLPLTLYNRLVNLSFQKMNKPFWANFENFVSS